MMGHNPYLDVEVKPTVHICMAIASYHTKRISNGVCSISKPAHELPTNGMRGTVADVPVNIFGHIRHKYYKCLQLI